MPRTWEQRREQLLAAAVKEFAVSGYHAASTTAIARRAGISQGTIYVLFADKRELFLAASRRAHERVKDRLAAAARGAGDPEQALARMDAAYVELTEERDELMLALQAQAAAGDPGLREAAREDFHSLVEHVARVSGASRERVLGFVARGMLLNVLTALGLPVPEAGEVGISPAWQRA